MANPVIINPSLTRAGQAAAFNAAGDGFELKLTHVSFGRAHYAPNGGEVALVDPVGSKIPLAGASRPTPYQIRTTVAWRENVGAVPIGEIGFWAGNTLVFVWSKADPTIVAGYKTDGVTYVLFNDLALSQVPPNSINFVVDPDESVALAALADHEGASNPHPQYLLRSEAAEDIGPLSWCGVAGGTANTLTLSLVAPESEVRAYEAGQRYHFLAKSTNTLVGVTANVEGRGAKSLRKSGDAGLVALDIGDIKAGVQYTLTYDGTYWQLGGGAGGGGKTFERFSFVAAVAQVDFIAAHVPGSIIVLRNGREIYGYTSAADGSKITLAIACNMDDRIDILAFKSFKVADSYTKAELNALLITAGAMPVGSMLPMPTGVVPPGYLELDGSVKSIAAYPDLAAYLGTAFNTGGEGAGNFRLPDSRGEFLRGWDHGRGVDVGRAIGSYQGDAIRNITGNLGILYRRAESGATSGVFVDSVITPGLPASASSAAGLNIDVKFDASDSVPTAAENRPRSLAVMWCIKAWNAPVNQGNIDIAALAALATPATEVKQGTARFGTPAEQLAGLLSTVMSNPAGVLALLAAWFPKRAFAANDSIRIPDVPGGLIVQFGSASPTSSGANTAGEATVSFPTSFPTAVRGCVLGMEMATGALNGSDSPYYRNLTQSGVTLGIDQNASSTTTRTVNYLAWGN